MSRPAFTLKKKFLSIIGLAGMLAALPVVYLSYNQAVELSVNQATIIFDQQVRLINELIEIDYIESVATAAGKAISDHEEMSYLASAVSRIYLSVLNSDSVVRTLQQNLSSHGIELMVASGLNPVVGNSKIEELIRKNIKDYRGVSIKELLLNDKASLASSAFTTVRFDETGPKVIGIWHLPQNESLIFMRDSIDRERSYEKIRFQVIGQVQDSLEQIPLHENASVALFNSRGTLLASAGTKFPDSVDLPGILSKAKAGMGANGLTTRGTPHYYSVYLFKPYDWFITAVLPERAVTQPALMGALTLAAVILAVFLITGLLAAFVVSRTLRPLGIVAERARRLSKIDFSQKSDFADSLLKGFSYGGRDEIGQLSGAFAHMIQELDQSISKLKKTLATQQRMEGELNAGHDIQRSILTPCDTPFTAPGFAAFAFMEPAKEVAGDLYDVIETPDGRQALIVGDVSGKGVSAALFMSMTITLIRYAIAEGYSPAQIMQRVNDQLAQNNPTCMFVTLWIGLLDPKSGELVFANGGHCPPAVINRASGAPLRWISELSGPVVGPLEGMEFTEHRTKLEPGDTCLIYSDGISEAMNTEKQLFGEERIGQVVQEHRDASVDALVHAVMDAVLAYRGKAHQSDDITMIAFSRTE